MSLICSSAVPGNDEPGQANLAICSSAVGQRYKCLAFTLEMPFKDTDYAREPVQVESDAKSANLPCRPKEAPCRATMMPMVQCMARQHTLQDTV